MTREIKTDVVIVGGGVGGVAAAIAVAESGLRCVVLEPSAWVGGQLTNQAVPPDENRWVESHGATRSYARFRERVRQHYRDHESLTPAALSAPHLNPGGGWVSRLCCSPRIAHAVLTHMLREASGNGRIEAFTRVHIESVDRDGDTVAAVQLRDDDGQALIVTGSVFLEASETGDLLELGGIEHRLGAEAAQTHD
ncbi:MAG: FAD-dependent oxidoreductase, partial [Planctomycetota bacterium]